MFSTALQHVLKRSREKCLSDKACADEVEAALSKEAILRLMEQTGLSREILHADRQNPPSPPHHRAARQGRTRGNLAPIVPSTSLLRFLGSATCHYQLVAARRLPAVFLHVRAFDDFISAFQANAKTCIYAGLERLTLCGTLCGKIAPRGADLCLFCALRHQ